jgi:hypothetical protein
MSGWGEGAEVSIPERAVQHQDGGEPEGGEGLLPSHPHASPHH